MKYILFGLFLLLATTCLAQKNTIKGKSATAEFSENKITLTRNGESLSFETRGKAYSVVHYWNKPLMTAQKQAEIKKQPEHFFVYPNPAEDQATVSYKLADSSDWVKLELFSDTGKLLKEIYAGPASAETTYNFTINLSIYGEEYYIVRLAGRNLNTAVPILKK